ncbi:MAG: hypothetical protein GY820_38655 [Gammaproteobacteria bacterium]|nr:hypothetical protein [Gammaproteobacteria bacterium]
MSLCQPIRVSLFEKRRTLRIKKAEDLQLKEHNKAMTEIIEEVQLLEQDPDSMFHALNRPVCERIPQKSSVEEIEDLEYVVLLDDRVPMMRN